MLRGRKQNCLTLMVVRTETGNCEAQEELIRIFSENSRRHLGMQDKQDERITVNKEDNVVWIFGIIDLSKGGYGRTIL